jgi:hypothetical protein
MSDLESIDENAVSLLAGTGPAHKIISGPWEGLASQLADRKQGEFYPMGYFLRDGYAFGLVKNKGHNLVYVSREAFEDTIYGIGPYKQGGAISLADTNMSLLLFLCPNLLPGVERPQWYGTDGGEKAWKL